MRNILLAMGLFVTPASAETLNYTGYAAGLPMLGGQLKWQSETAGYHVSLTMNSAGVVALLGPLRFTSETEGTWVVGGGLEPARPTTYHASSRDGARSSSDYINYALARSVPADVRQPSSDRVPGYLDPALFAHTIDGLSVIADLLHDSDGDAGCGGTERFTKSRELSEVTWRTVGLEQLRPSSYSTFAGAALRCDFVVRQLAGFPANGDRVMLQQPRAGSVWLARVDGAMVPVRVALGPQDHWGGLNAYLDLPAAAPGSPATPPPP